MIFPTQKSFFFRAARQAAVDTVKEEIPANPSNRHSPISENDFPDPKIIFFRAVCQVAVDNAKKEKSQQIPAIASET